VIFVTTPISALTLLLGQWEGHPACEKSQLGGCSIYLREDDQDRKQNWNSYLINKKNFFG